MLVAALIVLWVSGFLSALIDNIPYTAVTIPLVASLLERLQAGPDRPGAGAGGRAWRLACLGGNGTLIGASANVTVTGLAEKDGQRISFAEFTAFGARVTGITLAMSSVYLALWLFVGSAPVNIAGAAVSTSRHGHGRSAPPGAAVERRQADRRQPAAIVARDRRSSHRRAPCASAGWR